MKVKSASSNRPSDKPDLSQNVEEMVTKKTTSETKCNKRKFRKFRFLASIVVMKLISLFNKTAFWKNITVCSVWHFVIISELFLYYAL